VILLNYLKTRQKVIKMPPKKINAVEEELEEIRKSLNFKSDELSTVAKQQAMLIDLMVMKLVNEKNKKIE